MRVAVRRHAEKRSTTQSAAVVPKHLAVLSTAPRDSSGHAPVLSSRSASQNDAGALLPLVGEVPEGRRGSKTPQSLRDSSPKRGAKGRPPSKEKATIKKACREASRKVYLTILEQATARAPGPIWHETESERGSIKQSGTFGKASLISPAKIFASVSSAV